jgi:hypothetical protein
MLYVVFFLNFCCVSAPFGPFFSPKIKGDAPRHFDLLTRVYGSRHRPDLSCVEYIGNHSRFGEKKTTGRKERKTTKFLPCVHNCFYFTYSTAENNYIYIIIISYQNSFWFGAVAQFHGFNISSAHADAPSNFVSIILHSFPHFPPFFCSIFSLAKKPIETQWELYNKYIYSKVVCHVSKFYFVSLIRPMKSCHGREKMAEVVCSRISVGRFKGACAATCAISFVMEFKEYYNQEKKCRISWIRKGMWMGYACKHIYFTKEFIFWNMLQSSFIYWGSRLSSPTHDIIWSFWVAIGFYTYIACAPVISPDNHLL